MQYTNTQIDQYVLKALKDAAPGKDPQRRPKPLCSYQLADLLDKNVAANIINTNGLGGKGGAHGGSELTRIVQRSAIRLKKAGLVRYRFMATHGMTFEVQGQQVKPSYPVMGIFWYDGP